MITSEKVRNLVKTFERILPYAEHDGALDMGTGGVSCRTNSFFSGHKCGTVHCHAGWYLLAKMWDGKSNHLRGGNRSYLDGVALMMEDMGVSDSEYGLVDWASQNPDLWGNDYARSMFCENEAFTPGNKERAETLKDIVDHWRQVGDALEIAEIGGVV